MFEKLDIPQAWKDEWTKYPHGYTIFEALCKWVSLVNNMTDNINDWNEYLDDFIAKFELDLQEEVKSLLTEWQDTGKLDVIISAALQPQIDNVEDNLEVLDNDLQSRGASASMYVVGDGSTDDTVALQNLFDSGVNPIIISKKILITNPITITEVDDLEIIFTGEGQIITNNCSGLGFYNCRRLRLENVDILSSNLNWTEGIFGLQLDACNNAKVSIRRIEKFCYGLYMSALISGGCAYNNIIIDAIADNKHGIRLENGGTGWITENNFHGGRVYLYSNTREITNNSFGVYTVRNSQHTINNIRFYSPCFEGLHNGLNVLATEWLILHPRFEGILGSWITGRMSRSIYVAGYGGINPSKIDLPSNQNRNNIFLGILEGKQSVIHAVGGGYSGYSFLNYVDMTTLAEFKYNSARGTIRQIDMAGGIQVLNKQYQGTSGQPTQGNFYEGAVIWNSSPASGAPMGWVCTKRGTAGTLDGVTATGTSESTIIEVNDPANLLAGTWITAGGSARIIQHIDGNMVALNSSLGDITDQPITYQNPIFIPLANIP